MRVALIFPNARFNEPMEIFPKKVYKYYFGNAFVSPPLGLLYIATPLIKKGHTVKIFDLNVKKLTLEMLINQLQSFNPDLIGYSSVSHTFMEVKELNEKIKEFLHVPSVIGGYHMYLYPDLSMEVSSFDFGIIGEAEDTLLQLIEHYSSDKEYSHILGLIWRNNDKILKNPPRCEVKNLDSIDFPARDLINLNDYGLIYSKKKYYVHTPLITSRSCPFNCSFCTDRFTGYRERSIANIIEEIKYCYQKYGVKHFYFDDSTFTTNKKRTIELCNAIKSLNYDLIFSVKSRVDTIDEEVIKSLADSGCYTINFGIESGDNTILKRIQKNTNVNQIISAVKLSKKYKITIMGFFMLGCPGETRETIKKTLDLSLKLDLDYVQFTRFTPWPGSSIYRESVKIYGFDAWEEYYRMKRANTYIPTVDMNFSIEDLNKIIMKAYRRFYYRPKLIFRKIKELRSIGEFIKYFKGAVSLI